MQKKKYLHIKNIDELEKLYKSINKKHRVIQTSNTKKIECKDGNYIGFYSYLKKIDLVLIGRVKRHVLKENVRYTKRIKKIDYVTKLIPKIEINKEYFAIDITKAYWFTAYKEGFITGELFREGLKIKYSKTARLISLGALATKPLITDFNNGKQINITSNELETAPIFYRCAEVVNDLMHLIKNALKTDFTFFWVDCVYFKGEYNIKSVQTILSNFGYSCSIEAIKFLDINQKDKTILLEKQNKKKDKKLFHFKKY